MTERFTFIVFASVTGILMNPIVIIVAGLVLAVVIVVAALFLLRNSGKNKSAKADKGVPASDWQRQGQQPNAPGAWNQAGAPADWAQQQPAGWGAQTPAQQQPGAWGAQNPAQQQPAGWGAQSPAQQQPGAWGAQNPSPQQPGAWGAQSPAPQQPAANAWGAQSSSPQQPGAWGAQSSSPQQPAANAWGAQSSSPQQPGAWGAQNPSPQQPGAWGAQSPAQQQPAEWGAAPSSAPSAGAAGNPPAWGQDATIMPQKSAQDPWGQAQAPSQQQGASPWGMPGNPPSQQQAATGYGGSGSGQSWQQSGQPATSNDPWGQAAQPQPAAWGQQPFQQPASSSAPPTGGNAVPPWQQGPAQGQGFGAPGMQPDVAPMFGSNDNDKTMLRPSGPQGALGTVRVEEGKEPGRVYEVRKDELSIGRSRESDIFLEDLAVSRLHAKIVNLGNGNYALKDEGSANGTKVNGQLVNKYQTYPLQEGDKIQLGQTVLVFARR